VPTDRAKSIAAELLRDPAALKAQIAAERARRRAQAAGQWSFAEFVHNAWPIVDQRPLQWNRYLAALALHLESVARGRIRRLVGNGPPRMGKSNLFAIMWPAWIWACVNPAEAFIYLSYSDDLVTEHSTKCRALIESPWYQETFRPEWRLGVVKVAGGRVSNRQDDFANTAGGRRIASSIKSDVIGRGATKVCIDDPLSAQEARSMAERARALEVVQQAVATRFNDPATGGAVLLMQRMDPEDPAQWAIDSGWEHFCTPMEKDEREHVTYETVDGERRELWRDERAPGEVLDPERFPPEALAQIKKSFSPLKYAAQFGQRPVRDARAGKMFNRGMFKVIDAAPTGDRVVRTTRSWDLASTEGEGGIQTSGEPDWTVGGRGSLLDDGSIVIEHINDGQWGPREVRRQVKNTAIADGHAVKITLPQDPGQAGKDQASEYVAMLLGYTVATRRPTGDKVVRAGPASAQAQAGNIAVVRAPWNERFFQVLEGFPDPAVHDDHVDMLSDLIADLALGEVGTADQWLQANLDDQGDDGWVR
jgi:predicted phage terminase large subunit-like protein